MAPDIAAGAKRVSLQHGCRPEDQGDPRRWGRSWEPRKRAAISWPPPVFTRVALGLCGPPV